jgi:transposase-like protein
MSTKRYDNETKAQALRMMKEVGAKDASKQLGIPDDTIKYWDRQVRDGKLILDGFEKTPENALSVKDENRLLKDKLAKLEKQLAYDQEKIEFLEEATAFFAARHPKLKRMRDLSLLQ